MAALALLLSLAAAALAGWLFWQTKNNDSATRVQKLETELAEAKRQAAAQNTTLKADIDRIDAALADALEAQARQREARKSMAASVAAQIDRAPSTAREWQLAEVEYLLRVANHRLLMEHDAAGALGLLKRADEVLAELDDLAFHPVRAALADELATLRVFKGIDVQGVFLRLEAVKKLLGGLPVRLPEYIAAKEQTDAHPLPEEDPSMLAALAQRLEGLVRFRRHDGGPMRPLLPPEQAEYLEQHLRLALDRAQLAALRRNQAIFEASLGEARQWLHEFVDPSSEAAASALGELDQLLAVDLEATLPDISTSLARLQALRRGRSAQAAPA